MSSASSSTLHFAVLSVSTLLLNFLRLPCKTRLQELTRLQCAQDYGLSAAGRGIRPAWEIPAHQFEAGRGLPPPPPPHRDQLCSFSRAWNPRAANSHGTRPVAGEFLLPPEGLFPPPASISRGDVVLTRPRAATGPTRFPTATAARRGRC